MVHITTLKIHVYTNFCFKVKRYDDEQQQNASFSLVLNFTCPFHGLALVTSDV